jgi:hypothetical protein
MNGKRPYPGIHRKEYKEQISSTFVQIKEGEQPKDWSDDCVDITNKLLQRKEDLRLGNKGIDEIKNHSWFKDINWDHLFEQKIVSPFIPVCTEDYFDESYLQSFGMSTKLKDEINIQSKNIRNPNMQKLFKGFYYDKDKDKIKDKDKEKIKTNNKEKEKVNNGNSNKTTTVTTSTKS